MKKCAVGGFKSYINHFYGSSDIDIMCNCDDYEYIDGELVASKCRGPGKVENQRGDISQCMISHKHPVFVGGTANGSNNFVGCKSNTMRF